MKELYITPQFIGNNGGNLTANHLLDVSSFMYKKIKKYNSEHLELTADEESCYHNVLIQLNARGHIKKTGFMIEFTNSEYVIYMAEHFDKSTVDKLIGIVSELNQGDFVGANELASEFDIPRIVLISLFKLYANKGMGLFDSSYGHESYMAK